MSPTFIINIVSFNKKNRLKNHGIRFIEKDLQDYAAIYAFNRVQIPYTASFLIRLGTSTGWL
jgi:hypothetical protein